MSNCQCQSELEKQKVMAEFKIKHHDIPFEDYEVEDIYNKALTSYLDWAFPLHYHITEIPASRPRAYQWVKECMDEILDRNGINALSYSENGLSYTWSSDMVSEGLRSRIGAPLGRVGGTKI